MSSEVNNLEHGRHEGQCTKVFFMIWISGPFRWHIIRVHRWIMVGATLLLSTNTRKEVVVRWGSASYHK